MRDLEDSKNNRHEGAGKMDRPRSLTPGDIVTRPAIGRRSALSALGGTLVGAAALVAGSRPARADRVDVQLPGDRLTDADTGPFGDPAGDTDAFTGADMPGTNGPTVTGDPVGGGGSDGDVARIGDPVDRDVGPRADTGDSDITAAADPPGGRRGSVNNLENPGRRATVSDPADADVTSRADPIPASDKDPTDRPLSDADQPTVADQADSD